MSSKLPYGLVFALASLCTATSTETLLDQGFSFDYTSSGVPVPIPTTAQCDTIPLTWGRASFTSGPNPQAPYYIQVYTSTFLFPSVINVGSNLQFDWPVPYIPGTQYQICMFDSKGTSGGCQRMDTVVPAENTTLQDPPICTNLTYPAGILDVAGNDHTGTLSQYGWVDQCTDISIQPKNGTPPFILTVAPTLHPPWNITSTDMSPINWTVQLSWGSPFYISLVDAEGESWAFGPLHSGGQGPTGCLAVGATPSTKGITDSVAIGSGVGGLLAGIVAGSLAAWFLLRRRRGPYYDSYAADHIHNDTGKNGDHIEGSLYSAFPSAVHSNFPSEQTTGTIHSTTRRALVPGSAYEIEPFAMPDASSEGLLPKSPGAGGDTQGQPTSSLSTRRGDLIQSDSSSGGAFPQFQDRPSPQPHSSNSGGQVYVVHHDGGRAPVTVYTSEGAEVIELPPRYNPDDPPNQERRRAGATPRKPARSSGSDASDR